MAGQVAGLVNKVCSCREIIEEMVATADETYERLASKIKEG